MDKIRAREILGVSEDASHDEIRTRYRQLAKKYHPDVKFMSNTDKFVLISTAYIVLKDKQLGINIDKNSSDDISYALDLKTRIDRYFNDIFHEFETFRDRSQKEANKYLKDIIFDTHSSKELKTVLETKAKQYLSDMSEEFTLYLKKIERHIGTDESDFLFELFQSMYKENRRNWLISLWRNPVIIFVIVCSLLGFIIKKYPNIHNTYPQFRAIDSLWWLPFLSVPIGLIIIFVQYEQLDPRKIFQPMRFSKSRLEQLIQMRVQEIKSTPRENATDGAVTGAILLTFVSPGIGTLIGAALGGLLFFTGRDLRETQTKTYNDLTREIDVGLQQITNLLSDWAKKSRNEIHNAAVDSFFRNCRNIAGLIRGGHLPVQKILNPGKPPK
jgi:hypothetical protein